MKKLIRGIIEFRKQLTPEKRELFKQLALGQKPDALFIACSDSRVVPNLFASTDPGDLFVVRNVGNLIPPYSEKGETSLASSLEFSLNVLYVSDIIVCGHSGCGAMSALCHPSHDHPPHLKQWLSYGASPEDSSFPLDVSPDLSEEDRLSQANVLLQIEHLLTYPDVQTRVKEGELALHGWWFDIEKASVYRYEPSEHSFLLIEEATQTVNFT